MTAESIARGLLQAHVLGLTLDAEGRGEGIHGMAAIGATIENRRQWGRWGASWKDVCTARQQFSCWNPGEDENHIRLVRFANLLKIGITPEELRPALELADAVITGQVTDETQGADHYCTVAVLERKLPAWADPAKMTVSIGRHVFFRLRPVAEAP